MLEWLRDIKFNNNVGQCETHRTADRCSRRCTATAVLCILSIGRIRTPGGRRRGWLTWIGRRKKKCLSIKQLSDWFRFELDATHHTRWMKNKNRPGTTKSSEPTDQRRLKMITPGILEGNSAVKWASNWNLIRLENGKVHQRIFELEAKRFRQPLKVRYLRAPHDTIFTT